MLGKKRYQKDIDVELEQAGSHYSEQQEVNNISKEEIQAIIKPLIDSKANINNTIDLNAYALGAFDALNYYINILKASNTSKWYNVFGHYQDGKPCIIPMLGANSSQVLNLTRGLFPNCKFNHVNLK